MMLAAVAHCGVGVCKTRCRGHSEL